MEPLAALDAANVLLAAPTFSEATEEVCTRLRSGDGPAGRSLVAVTLTKTPDRWLEAQAGRLPDDACLVCVGEQARSAAGSNAETAAGTAGPTADLTIRTVSNPGNLTRLGVALVECLPAAAPAGGAPETALCFESVGTLFQHADAGSVFQFFQVLTNHVAASGVTAHYHVDPTAVDEREFGRLAVLFDAVVDVSEGEEVSVRTPPGSLE